MRGIALPRFAAVMAVSLLAAGACSSENLRDQNYGTDLAQGYRYPDGGYPFDMAIQNDGGRDGDGGGEDAGADADAGADPDATVDADTGAGG